MFLDFYRLPELRPMLLRWVGLSYMSYFIGYTSISREDLEPILFNIFYQFFSVVTYSTIKDLRHVFWDIIAFGKSILGC